MTNPKYPFTKTLYMTYEMYKAIKETAKRMNMPQSEWYRKALQERLDKDRWA